ncbi:MAG: hypothetical protein Q7S95_04160 [bacterium]|nr:hypothetical protein [bacterium]
MKVLGQGWQYTTYDLGNGRVLKKFHPLFKSYWVILKQVFPFQNDWPWQIPTFSRHMKEKAVESFRILKRHTIPLAWLGNPVFLNEFDFEQDKVRPLHDVLSGMSVDEAKKLIDDFVGFITKLLQFGVIDKSFNITKNYGLTDGGQLILLDIGELLDEPTAVEHQLMSPVWSKPYVAGCIEDAEVRRYFLEQMDEHFTPHRGTGR